MRPASRTCPGAPCLVPQFAGDHLSHCLRFTCLRPEGNWAIVSDAPRKSKASLSFLSVYTVYHGARSFLSPSVSCLLLEALPSLPFECVILPNNHPSLLCSERGGFPGLHARGLATNRKRDQINAPLLSHPGNGCNAPSSLPSSPPWAASPSAQDGSGITIWKRAQRLLPLLPPSLSPSFLICSPPSLPPALPLLLSCLFHVFSRRPICLFKCSNSGCLADGPGPRGDLPLGLTLGDSAAVWGLFCVLFFPTASEFNPC